MWALLLLLRLLMAVAVGATGSRQLTGGAWGLAWSHHLFPTTMLIPGAVRPGLRSPAGGAAAAPLAAAAQVRGGGALGGAATPCMSPDSWQLTADAGAGSVCRGCAQLPCAMPHAPVCIVHGGYTPLLLLPMPLAPDASLPVLTPAHAHSSHWRRVPWGRGGAAARGARLAHVTALGAAQLFMGDLHAGTSAFAPLWRCLCYEVRSQSRLAGGVYAC